MDGANTVKKGIAEMRRAHGTFASSILLIQQSPLVFTKWLLLERAGSRWIFLTWIFLPHRRSVVSSTPMATGPRGRKVHNNKRKRMALNSRLDQTAQLST